MTTIDKENTFCAHNYHPLPVVLTKGEGIWLWDDQGKKYLDMMSAYSAVSHGHTHPRLLKALTDQASELAITSRAFHTDKLAPFLEKICSVSGMDMALPMNTGAEAVETGVKAARLWGYKIKGIPKDKAEIIVAEENFHGRTTTVISFSSDEEYRDGFGPFTPGFKIVPYGDIQAMKDAVTENTCAILVEPIQGEAGVNVPPAGYLKDLRQLCDDENVLLILDEIQSGLGRTGKTFCFEHEGIKPDGLMLGKALGGGMMPVSCFLAKREVMELFVPGSHGSTFGGNPLAAAVALEALNLLEEEDLVDNSAELGAYMLEEISKIPTALIREVRGKGLWIGVDFDPEYVTAREICERLQEKGILSKETHHTVVRFAPPLIITRKEIDWTLEQFKDVIREVETLVDAA